MVKEVNETRRIIMTSEVNVPRGDIEVTEKQNSLFPAGYTSPEQLQNTWPLYLHFQYFILVLLISLRTQVNKTKLRYAPRTFNDSQLNLQVKSFLTEKSSTMLITWITDVKKAKNIRGVAKHNGLSFNRYSRSVAKIGGISRANISGVAVITSTLNAGDWKCPLSCLHMFTGSIITV